MNTKRITTGLSLLAGTSMLLAACGGTDPTATVPAAATAAPTAMMAGETPTAMMAAMTPTAMMAAMTPTAMMAAMTPTAMMAGETPTAMMAMTPTAMMAGETPTTAAMTGANADNLAGKADYAKIGPELADAMTGKYKGTKVTMFGPFGSDDEIKFNNSMKAFEAATGITIQYESSKEFETTINVRVEGGSAPDIADFPQPGLMASIAKSGKVQDINKMINPAWLKQNYNQGYLDTATVDSPSGKILGGVFQRVNAKGLVWYPKKAFDAAGYKTPTTRAEQQALMDRS